MQTTTQRSISINTRLIGGFILFIKRAFSTRFTISASAIHTQDHTRTTLSTEQGPGLLAQGHVDHLCRELEVEPAT